jgi:maltose/moltooligosaccharide transporter
VNVTSRRNPLPAPSPSQDSRPEKVYHSGSLRYTAGGLAVLSLWLLGGDFAFTFFESVFNRFIPLYLKDIHASNNVIGLMTGSIAGVVNILFLPNISQWSDRYRSSWGRRIPFLYVVTPLTVLALLAIGFAPEIAVWVHSHVLVQESADSLVLPLLCVFVVVYHFFNMVLVNAYNWLVRDVVPQELIARFFSVFRIVGTVSSFAFLWYVYPDIETHREEIFLGVSAFYLAVFLLMCWNVKEGAYPEPPAAEDRPGLVSSFVLYFRECLSVRIYRNFFLVYVLVTLAISCAGPFAILFARETLGLDLGAMGRIFAWGAAATAIAYWPMGWLCDRFSSYSVILWALTGFVIGSVLAFCFVAGKESLFVYSILFTIPSVGWAMGAVAATMHLFPKERFGQFSSGLSVFSCGAIVVGNYLVGTLMDLVHSNYRVNYLWSAVLFALALPPMFAVWREWKRLGGAHGYVPPLPECK